MGNEPPRLEDFRKAVIHKVNLERETASEVVAREDFAYVKREAGLDEIDCSQFATFIRQVAERRERKVSY